MKLSLWIIFCLFIFVNGENDYADWQPGKEPIYHIDHLDWVKDGNDGYNLLYYDGFSLRDEKWRFNLTSGDPVVNRRYGYRLKLEDKFNFFHILDDANGYTYVSKLLDPSEVANILSTPLEEPSLEKTYIIHRVIKYRITDPNQPPIPYVEEEKIYLNNNRVYASLRSEARARSDLTKSLAG